MLREILFYLKRSSKFCRETIRFLLVLLRDHREKRGSNADIRIAYNGYPEGPKRNWFADFVQIYSGQQVEASWYKPTLIFCSSFGSYWLLKILLSVFTQPSVFFSEENLATLKKYREYKSYLNGQPSLAMGFDYLAEENYSRFPLWLLYFFSPEFAVRASVQDIQGKLDRIEKLCHFPKTKFAAMVASHDGYASAKKVYGCQKPTSRTIITEQVSAIDSVHCPGRLLHNDDTLKNEYGDDKKTYLQQFLFNICAENASVTGYVTEKLFEAIEGGTIPIYWGAVNPEPGILNQKRVIFWDETRIEEVLKTIKTLYLDVEYRREFLREPVFTEHAAEEIYLYFERLRKNIGKLLRKD